MKKYYYNYYYSLAKMPKTLIYYVMHMNAGRSLQFEAALAGFYYLIADFK